MELTLSNLDIIVLSAGAIAFGFVCLMKGGDWTTEGAIYVAKQFGISPLVIGFTVVAFGTSLPELFVSINANLQGYPSLSVANVVGSNIANVLLIVGVTAAITPLVANPVKKRSQLVMMLGASLLLLVFTQVGMVDRIGGVIFFFTLVAYLSWRYWQVRRKSGELPPEKAEELGDSPYSSMRQAVLFLVLGLVSVSLGSEFLVRGAVTTADIIGVPEAVIGLTIISLGTSLPELSVCVAAGLKGRDGIVFGNVLGSNVFNILSIIGLTAIVSPLAINRAEVGMDVLIMVGVATFLAAWITIAKNVNRRMGLIFLVAYVGYCVMRYM